jgi:hypothetical protein
MTFWGDITAPVRAVGDAISDAARGVGHFFSEAGKWFSENWRMVLIVAVVIVIEVFTLGAATAAVGPLVGAILTGMAAGAASGALGAALYGGTIDDVLAGAFKGAIIGGASAAAFYGVGNYFQAAQGARESLTTSEQIESIAAHGVVGGAKQAAEGGNFWQGFVATAATKAGNLYGPRFSSFAGNVAKAAIVGGTVAQISGGKFANGAILGSFSYSFNDSLHDAAMHDAILPTVTPIEAAILALAGAPVIAEGLAWLGLVEVPVGPTPDFVVSPEGTAFPVPPGAEGPVPVINSSGNQTGTAYEGGNGGANGQVDTIRIMNPTPPRGSSPGYPDGYIKYQNPSGQGVDPYSGQTLPNSQSHFPIR